MLACRVTAFDQLPEIQSIEIPEPKDHQVRLTVKACGLNFADLLMQAGTYQDTPKLPFTLGMEVAGEINAVGKMVRHLSVGDRVAVFGGQGGLAEQANYDAQHVLKIPDTMNFEHAAAFQIAYGTSHVALAHRAKLVAGETLVVLGAAGGVGLTAIEIGKALEATVIAVARGVHKLDVAQSVGADHVIDSDNDNLRDTIRDLGGADVVYDPVGGAGFMSALRACNPEARYLTIGFASGDIPQIPANYLLVKNVTIHGFYWGGYRTFRPDIISNSLTELIHWYGENKLRPHISHRLPLKQAVEGLEILRKRQSTGKIIIIPDG
ncbi:MAG: NADPH:quinone oxidoreductase family protein [Aestuariivita sp.]|nr:NADPH:quinone oxidoreductase family protein [Aestuariivita sp.]